MIYAASVREQKLNTSWIGQGRKESVRAWQGSAGQGRAVQGRAGFVFFARRSVCPSEWIDLHLTFTRGPRNNRLNLGDDLDYEPDIGSGWRSRSHGLVVKYSNILIYLYGRLGSLGSLNSAGVCSLWLTDWLSSSITFMLFPPNSGCSKQTQNICITFIQHRPTLYKC